MSKARRFQWDFILLLIAVLFLADPVIAFKDLLPDVVGYALLFFGLSRLSDLNEGIYDCRRRLRLLFILGAVQLLAELLVQLYMPAHIQEMNKYELPVAILLCSFFMLLVRLCWLIPFLRTLFSELEQLASCTNGTALLREHKRKTVAERTKNVCTVCIVISSVCAVLPEVSVLTSFEAVAADPLLEFEWYQASMQGTTTANTWFDWFPYVGTFRTVAAVLSLISGVVLLVSYVRFFAASLADHDWLTSLNEKYKSEILPQSGLLTVRRIRMGLGLLFIGSIFLLSIRLGFYPVFPSAIFALLSAVSVLLLAPMVKQRKVRTLATLPLFIVSVASFVLTVLYLTEHVPKDSLHQTGAYWDFLTIRMLGIAESVGVIIVWIVLYLLLRNMVNTHTATTYENDAALSERATDRLHQGLIRKLNIVFILLILSAIGTAAEAYFQAIYTWLWLPINALTVAAIICLYSFLKELYEQICAYHHSNGVNKGTN